MVDICPFYITKIQLKGKNKRTVKHKISMYENNVKKDIKKGKFVFTNGQVVYTVKER